MIILKHKEIDFHIGGFDNILRKTTSETILANEK
jgi:hypothetical protein